MLVSLLSSLIPEQLIKITEEQDNLGAIMTAVMAIT